MYRVLGEASACGSAKLFARLSSSSGLLLVSNSFSSSLLTPNSALTQRRWSSTRQRRGVPLPPPPGSAVRGGPAGLPPPPPLTSAHLGTASGAGTTHNPVYALRSPQDVLATFIPYVPTYYVSIACMASLLPEELWVQFIGRGKLLNYLRRFPFLFDVQGSVGAASLVRLHRDVSHPARGTADEKYMMTDVGEVTSYIAKPEYIQSTESMDTGQRSVLVKPLVPPPAVSVRMEERVPVVDRLRSLVPADFVSIETLEETIPEDVLFHPYFDCQGGLLSIAAKLPDELQVVDGFIRRRPRHLAPLALDEYSLADSPLPEVAAMLQREVCDGDIPHWVSITPLYEKLTREQKHLMKQRFRSFAGFLRAHGRSLAVSTDMLQVSMWICVNPPPDHAALASDKTHGTTPQLPDSSTAAPSSSPSPSQSAAATSSPPLSNKSTTPVTYTREEILNAWYDCFPPHKTLNLREAMALLPVEMRTSGLPTKIAPWLATHPQYFVVDYMEEEDPTKVLLRRASDRQPLDLAAALYAHMPQINTDYNADEVLREVEPSVRHLLEDLGMEQMADVLPQWMRVSRRRGSAGSGGGARPGAEHFTVRRLQTLDALEKELHRRGTERKMTKKRDAAVTDAVDAEDIANLQ